MAATYAKGRPMKAIELFAGAGGAALGLEAAGIGNAVPPRLAEVVGRAIVEADRMLTEAL